MIRSLEVLASSDTAQGCTCWLGFCRNLFPVGTFTVFNQRMFPRSDISSTSVTFRMPCGSPLGMLILAMFKIVYNTIFIAIFTMIVTMGALHPPAEASGLSAPWTNNHNHKTKNAYELPMGPHTPSQITYKILLQLQAKKKCKNHRNN